MNNKIENIFKEKLNSYEATPRADLFETIQLKKAKNKRVQWYWVTAGLMSFMIIASVIYVAKFEKGIAIKKRHHPTESLLTQPTKNIKNAEYEKSNTTTHALNNKEETVNINTSINIPQWDKKQLNSNATSKIKQANPLPISPIVNQKLADKFAELYLQNKNVDPSKIRIFTTKGEINVDKTSISTPNIVSNQSVNSENQKIALKESVDELPSAKHDAESKIDLAKGKKKSPKKVVKKISKLKHSRNRKSQKYRYQNNSYPKY